MSARRRKRSQDSFCFCMREVDAEAPIPRKGLRGLPEDGDGQEFLAARGRPFSLSAIARSVRPGRSTAAR